MPYPVLPGSPLQFGGLPLDPVPILNPPGDVVIGVFGAYLYAVMLSRLSESWAPYSGGAPIVKKVGFNNPEDNTINSRDLPGLFIYRKKSDDFKPERISDDLWQDTRRIFVHWVPNQVKQELEAKRSPYLDAIRKTIKDAIFQERHVAWKKPGETDPYAKLKGTCITTTAGLWQRPVVEGIDEFEMTFRIEGEAEDTHFVGLRGTILTVEGSVQDQTAFVTPPKNDGKVMSRDGTRVEGVFSEVEP